MKNITLLLFLSLLPISFLGAESMHKLNLAQCYEMALANSEKLAKFDEGVRMADARYQELTAVLYPNIHLKTTQKIKNSATNYNNFSGSIGSAQGQGKHPFDVALTVKQPIFSGFRDYLIAKAGKSEITASRYDLQRQKEILYQEVTQIFYQTKYYEQDLKLLSRAEDVLTERMRDLQRFIDLGRARQSEIEAGRSDLADVGATKARVLGLYNASKEMLAFLINLESKSIAVEQGEPAQLLGSEQALVEQSRQRSDVLALNERVSSAMNQRKATEREKFPVVSLDGNYYPYEHPNTDREWDIMLQLDLPLYEGGGMDAKIAESMSKESTASLNAKEAVRIVEREVRIAYQNVEASKLEISRLNNLITAARKNYEAQKHDYELGVVTNLDVLASIRSELNASRALIDAQTNLNINIAKLKVAVGGVA